ncbi:MAG: PadR family transcriptional regulator [Acidimicrobiia bacterium]
MIELAILGLLREQDLHGYELKKRIQELHGSRLTVSFGSLYPALARLEAAGAVKTVEARSVARPGTIPATGSLSGEANAFFARRRALADRDRDRVTAGRGRKVYGITDEGHQYLDELLDDPTTDDKTFPLKVAFCRYLPAERRLELFERRRSQLAGVLAGERTNRRRVGDRIDQYLRSLREHDTESIQHDITWLDRLIDEERQSLATINRDGQGQEDHPS